MEIRMQKIFGWIRNEPYWAFGLLLGFLPVVAGLIFRTYTYNVAPFWLENLRQVDVLFIVFEIAIVLVARERGMGYLDHLRELSWVSKLAALIFILTFWWSSLFVSQAPALAMFKIMVWIVHIAFGLAIYHLAKGMTLADIEVLSKGLFWGLCAYTPILFLHFCYAPPEGGVPGGKIIWASGLPGYLSVRLLGFYTAALSVLALALLWGRQRFKRADLWLYCMLTLSLTVTFWSGTRSGVYAILIAFMLILLLSRSLPSKFWMLALFLSSAAAFWLSEQFYQPTHEFGLLRLGGDEGSNFVTGRDIIWTFAAEKIGERPLFGWGEAAIVWLHERGAFYQQPHNAFLQMLLHWGTIATVSAILILSMTARTIILEIRRVHALLPLVAVLLALTAMSMVDGILYHPRIAILVIAAVASSLAIVRSTQAAHEQIA